MSDLHCTVVSMEPELLYTLHDWFSEHFQHGEQKETTLTCVVHIPSEMEAIHFMMRWANELEGLDTIGDETFFFPLPDERVEQAIGEWWRDNVSAGTSELVAQTDLLFFSSTSLRISRPKFTE
jgi:hypothetical protein